MINQRIGLFGASFAICLDHAEAALFVEGASNTATKSRNSTM